MIIAILGAGGFIGKAIVNHFNAHHTLILISRRLPSTHNSDNITRLQYKNESELMELLAMTEFDVIINLAGEPISGKRWTNSQKEKIRNSRILTTRAVVDAIQSKTRKPELLINASAIGYYGDTGDRVLDESAPNSSNFLGQICYEWEQEALKAELDGVRVILLRFGLVLGMGGALKKMIPPFRWFAGGPLGDGHQWLSWIHIDDVIQIIETSLSSTAIRGAINAVSPEPVTMNEFARMLGNSLHRPAFFRVSTWVLKIMLGEMASLLIISQKIRPQKLINHHYIFRFVSVKQALKYIVTHK